MPHIYILHVAYICNPFDSFVLEAKFHGVELSITAALESVQILDA